MGILPHGRGHIAILGWQFISILECILRTYFKNILAWRLGSQPKIKIFQNLFYSICIGILPSYISVHHMHARCLWRVGEGIGSPETEITDSWEPLYVYWESNPGPPEKQSMIFTAELSLKLHLKILKLCLFIFCVHVCMCRGLRVGVSNCGSCFSPFTVWVVGTKLTSLGLVQSLVTC